MESEVLKNQAKNVLLECLNRVSFLEVESIREGPSVGESRADLSIRVVLPGGTSQDLVVEVKNNGQPRIAREAINSLKRFVAENPSCYGIFMAPYISPRAAEILSKEGIGYLDLSGNMRLCFGQVYIEQDGRPNIFAQKRDLRSLYSPKACRVLRVLLSVPKKSWKIKELSIEAKVSLGQVSNVKKLLNDREWIRIEQDGFSLIEPLPILMEWSQNYDYRKNRVETFYSLKDIAEIEADLSRVCSQEKITYALTGFSGGARFAPAVRYQRVYAYVESGEKDIASLMDLKRVPSGANVILLSPYDEGVFYGLREIEEMHIATPIQVYLDLKGIRGRGEEAANTLLEKEILPQW
ncbi:MAG: type IV toxin-antitoxin system AbiEi family antitoxin [bacterium]